MPPGVFAMPNEELTKAKRYRKKALELRAMANDDICEETRGALLQVAESYDRMADALETVDRTNTRLRDI